MDRNGTVQLGIIIFETSCLNTILLPMFQVKIYLEKV